MAEVPSAVGLRRRACINCTAGKAKCTPFSSDECERCHRLGKECRYINVSTTRRRPKANARLQMLERRVEELAAHQASPLNQSQTPAAAEVPIRGVSNSTSSGASAWPNHVENPSSSRLTVNSLPRIPSTSVSTNDGGIGDIVDRALVTLESAQILLNRFQHSAAQQFPFVVIPPGTTVSSIRKDTPFLFLTIMATMMFDNPFLQRQLGEEIRNQVFRRMLFGFEKSLDLLQGLLIYAAWYFCFYRREKQQVFLITQLCVTLAHDLGIDKNKKQVEMGMQDPGQEPSSSLNNAQMRAFLGTYCVSCSVASSLRRRSAMAYTKYMEYCCLSLARVKEYPTDGLIEHIVRSQELARRIFDTFSYEDLNNGEIRGELIVALTSDAFIRDLDRLQLALPRNLQQNAILTLELHALRIMIHEVALHEEFWNVPKNPPPASDSNLPSVVRSRMLWSSLHSCKAFIHMFLSYQSPDLFFLTAFTFSRLCYVFITLAKLLHLDLDGSSEDAPQLVDPSRTQDAQRHPWHTMSFAKEADFSVLASKVREKFIAVATDFVGEEGERDAMWNLSSMVSIMMSGYEKQMKEKQKAMLNAEASAKELDLAQEQIGTAIHPNSFPSQAIGGASSNGTFGASSLEQGTELQSDLLDEMVWNQILDDFMMVPLP